MSQQFAAYQKKSKKNLLLSAAFFILILLLLVLTLNMGAMNIGTNTILQIILGKITNNTEILQTIKPNQIAVIWDIRLPRILCGIFVGAGLSISGVIFQSLLRNPLADPYTIGVSTGAAFGASLAILLNITYGLLFSTAAFAFIFAFLTLISVILISQKGGGMLSSSLIISGIIVSSILSSGISFIKMIAGEDVSAIVFWLMGSLSSRQWSDVRLVVPIVIIGGVIAWIFSDDLNIMILGDETAQTLGVNTRRIRLIYLIIGSSITAGCVAVSGIIGFIGLIVPHILRFWITRNNRILLPLSGLIGALILCLADNATRLFSNSEIPVGVLTTLIGGPFFIYIFLRKSDKTSGGL
jgi:iron complex transport system permease protein